MTSPTTNPGMPTPAVIDDSWILLRLQKAIRAVDQALGDGAARAHPQLIAACLMRELAEVVAAAIREQQGRA